MRKAGLRTLSEFAILWYLAQCGLTGARLCGVEAATGIPYNTAAGVLSKLQTRKLAVCQPIPDQQGQPVVYVISRLGYRLMTGHLVKREAGGQLPMGSEVIHTS